MAARFPQSTTAVAYQIKAAWASKIKAIYWAADANKVHRLLPGETVSTIITRSATGTTYNSTDGRIQGTPSALFTDGISGGIGGLKENSNMTFGFSWWGDLFAAGGKTRMIGSLAPPTGSCMRADCDSYTIYMSVDGAGGINGGVGIADDSPALHSHAWRYDAGDATAKLRGWQDGSEVTAFRSSPTTSSTSEIGGTGRPLYFGGSLAASGNTQIEFESAFLAGVLTDAEMVTITSDPASVIEVAAATITVTPDPSSVSIGSNQTMTITRSTAAPAGGVTYNLTSDTPATATVPATATILEGTTSVTFTATSVGIGTTVITATNAADSGETDSVTHNVTSVLVKKAKFVVHSDFQSATNITIDVFQAPGVGALTGARLGAANGINAEATLEGGQAVIKVPATSIGATGLSVGTSVRAVFKGTTSASSPLGNAVEGGSVATATGSIIEE
jgi:hypothetical protein